MTLPLIKSNPFTRPDPHSFKQYDYWLHRDGTHGFCVQALWRVGRTDLSWLIRFSASRENNLVTPIPGTNKYRIFDVEIQAVEDYDAPVPQLIFTNHKRVPFAR